MIRRLSEEAANVTPLLTWRSTTKCVSKRGPVASYPDGAGVCQCLPFGRIGCGLKGLCLQFSVLLEEDLYFPFGVLEFLPTIVGKLDAFFEKLQCLFKRNLSLFELVDDLLEALNAFFKLRQKTPLPWKEFYCNLGRPELQF